MKKKDSFVAGLLNYWEKRPPSGGLMRRLKHYFNDHHMCVKTILLMLFRGFLEGVAAIIITYQEPDDDLIDIGSMANNTALHFPVAISHINNLTRSKFDAGKTGEARPNDLRFRIFSHFPGEIETDGIAVGHYGVFRRFDRLNYSWTVESILPGCHHPGAQDGPLGQPLTR